MAQLHTSSATQITTMVVMITTMAQITTHIHTTRPTSGSFKTLMAQEEMAETVMDKARTAKVAEVKAEMVKAGMALAEMIPNSNHQGTDRVATTLILTAQEMEHVATILTLTDPEMELVAMTLILTNSETEQIVVTELEMTVNQSSQRSPTFHLQIAKTPLLLKVGTIPT